MSVRYHLQSSFRKANASLAGVSKLRLKPPDLIFLAEMPNKLTDAQGEGGGGWSAEPTVTAGSAPQPFAPSQTALDSWAAV